MKLRKLQLENFRNYKKHTYTFSDDKPYTILIGPNGKGKTNFLEAIYVLSLGRSFRTLFQEDLVEWDEEYLRCNCEIVSEDESTHLEVFYSHNPKKKNFKKNEVNLKNSEYLGNLLTVLFHPEDLNMLYLSPSFRRKYMNILISQTDKKYINALSQYKKTLKQRNALLHQIREKRFSGNKTPKLEENLEAWNIKLVEFGSYVTLKRIELIEFLNKNLKDIYQSISNKKEEVKVEYINTIFKEIPQEEDKNISSTFKENLSEKTERDIRTAKTSVGPHLDDLTFFINDCKIASSASRGEFRTLLLAIKLIEIDFIKLKTDKNPILLLDDVFSELDRKRQNHLLKAIKNCQTIITTTDIENMGKLAKESALVEFVSLE